MVELYRWGPMRRLLCLLVLVGVSACGKDSPTAPTVPTLTTTRVIRLAGSLAFGNVIIGTEPPDNVFTITNDGNAPLSVSGITGPCAGGAVSVIGSTAFAVAPQQTITITLRFRPTAVQSCSGTITVTSNATTGGNTIGLTAVGVAPPRPTFSITGVGDSVFDMPLDVTRVRVIGIYNGYSSNFIVRLNGRSIVNELLGDGWGTRRYDGTLLTGGGGVVSIVSSSGVQWSFEEVGR